MTRTCEVQAGAAAANVISILERKEVIMSLKIASGQCIVSNSEGGKKKIDAAKVPRSGRNEQLAVEVESSAGYRYSKSW